MEEFEPTAGSPGRPASQCHPTANARLIDALRKRGWTTHALESLARYPAVIRSGGFAHDVLENVSQDLAVAIDTCLASDTELAARTEVDLLAQAMIDHVRAARAPRPEPERPASLAPGSQPSLILIVDAMERSRGVAGASPSQRIVSELQARGVACERRALAVGDYIWLCRDPSGTEVLLNCIAERKTSNDLASSVRDGRYHEQKYRLAKSRAMGLRHIAYVVEGPLAPQQKRTSSTFAPPAWRERAERAMLTAVAHTFCHSQLNIAHTHDLAGTVEMLASTHARLQALLAAGDTPAVLAADQHGARLTFADFQRTLSKRDEHSATNAFGKMLMQVQGCSAKIATAVLDAYPTSAALFDAYVQAGSEADCASLLQRLKLKGSSRTVGPVVSARIYATMVPGGRAPAAATTGAGASVQPHRRALAPGVVTAVAAESRGAERPPATSSSGEVFLREMSTSGLGPVAAAEARDVASGLASRTAAITLLDDDDDDDDFTDGD